LDQLEFLRGVSCPSVAGAVLALGLSMLALVSCGDAFTSTGDGPDGGQAGQNTPPGPTDAAMSERGTAPKDSGSIVNPNATIACSGEQCQPGVQHCCIQNSKGLNDFCVTQTMDCKSDNATVTLLECDDGEDCVRAGKAGTICCAHARTFDIAPDLPVWAWIQCVPPSSCLGVDDDVFCGSNPADCPAGKTCSKTLGPYTYCE
jgi:hypothetical protein